ncbi:MAG: MATE family efflux transporter [Lachnospiraceae bacterium]|nr:MATE family efflux transporter [Lachnospiraceae bacterium]
MKNMEKKMAYQADIREFIKGIFLIGLPIMIQTLVNSLVNMVDVFMVGQLGEVSITASSLGNSWFFMYALLIGGITAAGSIFIAQYWGAKETAEIHKYMGIMFVGTGMLMLIFGLLSICGSGFVIRLYSKDPAVIDCGSRYIRIIGFSYFLFPITNVFVTALKSTENARIPMVGTLLSLFCNLTLNYILIFGHFGVPKLGVTGAAIATLIARIIEFLFIAGYVFIRRPAIAAGFKAYFSFSKIQIVEYIRYGFFIILGECIYAVGTAVYNVAYKYTGTESQAALQIVNSLSNLAMVTAIGIGQSAGVVVGKQLGKNEIDKSKRFCNLYLLFSGFFSLLMALMVVLVEPWFVECFQIGTQAKEYVMKMTWVLALTLPFKGINFTIVTGILRSGGDSNYCFLANFIGTWVVGIPLAFLGAALLHLPVYYVYLLIGADEVSKFIICLPRALHYRWAHNLSLSEK